MAENTLPDRDTLEERIEDSRERLFNAQAIVQSIIWAIRNELDGDTDPAHSITRALAVAVDELERVGSALDTVRLFSVAETQEAANG